MYDYSIYIGRFQPFHLGHLDTCKKALKKSKHLIIFIGSAYSSPTIRNPFSWEMRREMISSTLNQAGYQNRFTVLPIRDYYYSDNAWVGAIQKGVEMIASPNSKIALVGLRKDHTSYYLGLFPKWDFLDVKQTVFLSATPIREAYFTDHLFDNEVPEPVGLILVKYMETPEYKVLQKEWDLVERYMAKWGGTPYSPVFVTTDAVVACGGHILLVVRKGFPGEGQFALPGGFLNANETLENCVIRELKEETRIAVPRAVLVGSIVDRKVFDNPLRSVCGRRVTHAYYLQLKDEKLPKVKGADDAEKAFWMQLSDISKNADRFFEDHYQIIESFIGNFNKPACGEQA